MYLHCLQDRDFPMVKQMENETATVHEVEKKENGLPRDFKLVILNSGFSRMGMMAYGIVILWVTLALTHSTVLTGLADGMVSLPLFASFLVGAYIDRSPGKKTLAILASLARPSAIVMLFIALLLHSILLLVLLFFSTSILIGFTSDVMNSVRSVWSKRLLNDNTYKKGTSLIQAVTAFAETAGYGIAGTVLVLGFDRSFLSLIVIFAAALLAILPIRAPREIVNNSGTVAGSVREGMGFIRGNTAIFEILVLALLANFIFGTIGVGLTALVQVDFRLSGIYFGSLLLVFGIAAIFGSILGSKVSGSVGRELTVTLFLVGLFIGLVGLSPSIFYDYFLMVGTGILIGLVNVAVSTLAIKKVPEGMMARVQGTFSTFGLGMTFLSGTVGGVIIALSSVRIMLGTVCIAAMIIAAMSLTFGELNRTRI